MIKRFSFLTYFPFIVLPLFQDSKSEEILVLRSDLIQLDYLHSDKISDCILSSFCTAFFDFPEWDDHSRLSYEWSPKIIELGTDMECLRNWCAIIADLGLRPEMFDGSMNRMFLYALCADQSGLLIESHAEKIVSRSASEAVLSLYDAIKENKDINEKNFRRTSSRVGEAYQAPIADISSDLNSAPNANHVYSVSISADIIPNIDDFLLKVLSMKLVLPGDIISLQVTRHGVLQLSKCIVTKVSIFGTTDDKGLAQNICSIFSDLFTLSLADIEAANRKVIVSVYDANQSSWTVDGTNIKVLNSKFTEEFISNMLHDCAYDVNLCFQKIFERYATYLHSTNADDTWTRDEFDAFYAALFRYFLLPILFNKLKIIKYHVAKRKIFSSFIKILKSL